MEVLVFRSRAILLHHASREETAVLLISPLEPITQEDVLKIVDLEKLSHRKRLERLIELRTVRQSLIDRFRASGLSENEALLRTSDELERLGYYPKSPKILAVRTAETVEDLPVFTISQMEFTVGLFQDIEQAIAGEGQEVDFSGRYIRHRDFDTSERINAWLKIGETRFYADTPSGTYLMEIRRHDR